MKQHLSKLIALVLSFFQKKPKPSPTIRHQFNAIQKLSEQLDDISFWFACMPEVTTEEIAQQLENTTSRMAALTSAILIKIRADEELEQIERMKAKTK